MGEKRHSYGTKLGHAAAGTAAGGSFTDIAGIKNITIDGITVSATDTTDLQSTSAFREFVSGLGDAGEVSLDLHADDSEVNTLYGFLRTTRAWELTWPALSGEVNTIPNFVCDGFITSIGSTQEEDEAVMLPITIKWTGKPTFTVGAA